MAIIAEGQVSDRPFARTIYTIAGKRFTGDLVMTQGDKVYRVTWREGFVVAADSPAAADSVARQAIAAGLVNTTQISEVLRQAQLTGRPQLDVLAEVAGLAPAQRAALERRVFVYQAVRIFALPEARFALDDAPEHTPEAAPAPLDPRWFIYYGLRAHYSAERLTAELGAGPGARFRLEERVIPHLVAFGFGDEEKPVLAAIRQQALTLDDLCRVQPALDRTRLLCMLYALAAGGGVAIDAAEAGAGAPAPPAAPVAAAPARAARPTGAPAPARAARPTGAPAPARAARPTGAPAPARAARPTGAPAPTPSPAAAPARAARPTGAPAPAPAPARAARPTGAPAPAPAGEGEAAGHNRVRTGVRAISAEERSASADIVRRIIEDKLAVLDAGADYFQLFGLRRGASDKEVSTNYFDLARKLHPDRLHALGVRDLDEQAQRLFAEINRAFGVLGNPTRREEYLRVLAAGGEKAVRAQERRAEEMALKIIQAEEQFQIGEMALRRQQFAVACEAFQKAAELNPEEGEHHTFYGWALWCSSPNKGEVLDQVMSLIKKGIALAPRSANAFFYRGQIAKVRGQDETAAECFRKVLEIEPHHRDAQLELRVLEKRLEHKDDKDKGGKGLLDRLRRK